ncbi:hypothetical protein CPB85DRAFT_1428169 [Mucidula mucida]|nr:hypothetical protein CPB85DRAFT_1428169 [Mucidula mucida]
MEATTSSYCEGCPPYMAKLTIPMLVGHLLNWALFSVLSVQIFIYCVVSTRVQCRRWPNYLVAWIFLAEVVQTVTATIDAFRDFGTGWGNFEEFQHIGLMWFSVPVMTAIISATGQLFFAWRLYALSDSIYMPAAVATIACIQAGAGFWVAAMVKHVGLVEDMPHQSFVRLTVWLGGTAICDILISTSMMFYYLKRDLSHSGSRSANTAVISSASSLKRDSMLGARCPPARAISGVSPIPLLSGSGDRTVQTVLKQPDGGILNSHVLMVEHRAPLTGGSTFSIFDTPSMARRMQNMALNGHSDNRENGDHESEENVKRSLCVRGILRR